MEQKPISSKSNKFYEKAEFWNTIISEFIFYFYILFINALVLQMLYNIPIINHLGDTEINFNIPNPILTVIILLVFLLGIYSLIKLLVNMNQ